jgi:hypothetical protein
MKCEEEAIPSQLFGLDFRSRTEARWAVVLKELGIPFEYEKQGYKLPSRCYLPDFYLPTIPVWQSLDQESPGVWLEIKPYKCPPERRSPTDELAVATKRIVFTFYGMPPRNGDPMFLDEGEFHTGVNFPEGTEYGDRDYWLCECPHCGLIGIEFNGRADRLPCDCPKSYHGDKGYNYDSLRLRCAYEASRESWKRIERKYAFMR